MQKLIENLEIAARRDFKRLAEICGVDQEDVIDMLAELRTLTPRPGALSPVNRLPPSRRTCSFRELPNGHSRSSSTPTRCRSDRISHTAPKTRYL